MIIKNGGARLPLADAPIKSVGWTCADCTSYYTLTVDRRNDGGGNPYMHVKLTQLEMERVVAEWIRLRNEHDAVKT